MTIDNTKQTAKKVFAKQLKMALKNKDMSYLSYNKLAGFFQVSEMAVYNWLNARSMPAMTRLPDIANKLAVSVEYLLPMQIHTPHQVFLDNEQQLLNSYRQLSKTQKQLLKDLIKELK